MTILDVFIIKAEFKFFILDNLKTICSTYRFRFIKTYIKVYDEEGKLKLSNYSCSQFILRFCIWYYQTN